MKIDVRAGLSVLLVSLAQVGGCGSDAAVPTTIAEAATARGFYVGVTLQNASEDSQAAVPTHFNSVSTGNTLKWQNLAETVGNYDFTEADAVVELAERAGVPVRGNAILWRDRLPFDIQERLDEAPDPEQGMRELVRDHLTVLLEHYQGRVGTWDIVFEPLEPFGPNVDQNLFYRTLGPGYIGEVLRMAHEIDPTARLCINEFLWDYVADDERTEGLVALARGLLEEGAPLDCVGIHGHFTGLNPGPDSAGLEGALRRFTELGVEVELTEVDISITNFLRSPNPLEDQAVAFAGITRACLAVEGCVSMTIFGLRDDETWLDRFLSFSAPHSPLLFDAALMPKPAYWSILETLRTHP